MLRTCVKGTVPQKCMTTFYQIASTGPNLHPKKWFRIYYNIRGVIRICNRLLGGFSNASPNSLGIHHRGVILLNTGGVILPYIRAKNYFAGKIFQVIYV